MRILGSSRSREAGILLDSLTAGLRLRLSLLGVESLSCELLMSGERLRPARLKLDANQLMNTSEINI